MQDKREFWWGLVCSYCLFWARVIPNHAKNKQSQTFLYKKINTSGLLLIRFWTTWPQMNNQQLSLVYTSNCYISFVCTCAWQFLFALVNDENWPNRKHSYFLTISTLVEITNTLRWQAWKDNACRRKLWF